MFFDEHEIKILQLFVEGTFYKEECDNLIFSSHTFPSHRITVVKEKAKEFLDSWHKDNVDLSNLSD